MIPETPRIGSAIVQVSWAPLRREPRHASEMVSQLLLGEALDVLEPGDDITVRPGWAVVRMPDGYKGFVTSGSLLTCTESVAAEWISRATTTSLGTGLNPIDVDDAGDRPPTPRYAPWGSKLSSPGGDRFELPGGTHAGVTDLSRMVADADRADRYPRSPAAIVQTAMGWMGTPYVWGGRTEQGADCSGFVQSVFGLHGVALDRDSGDQFEAGSKVGGPESGQAGVAGDLW